MCLIWCFGVTVAGEYISILPLPDETCSANYIEWVGIES